MEQTNNNPQTDTPAATDVQNLDAIASQLLDIIMKMESLVPDFEPHDKREIKRVAASAKFAHELIAPTVTIVTVIPSVPQDLFNVALAKDALAILNGIPQRKGRDLVFGDEDEVLVASPILQEIFERFPDH